MLNQQFDTRPEEVIMIDQVAAGGDLTALVTANQMNINPPLGCKINREAM